MAPNTPIHPPPPPRPRFALLRRAAVTQANERWLLRLRDGWQRLLGVPAIWLALLLLLGTWSLTPGSFSFAPRALPGTIASHDYVAPRDLLILDEEASREKQQRARDAVLQVYDLDPGVLAERDQQVEGFFNRGRRLLARAGEGEEDGPARDAAVAAELTSRGPAPGQARGQARDQTRDQARDRQMTGGLDLAPEVVRLFVRESFSRDLEDRLRGLLAQALRRGVVANKALLLANRVPGIALRNLATGTEIQQFDLFDYLGYPDEARDFLETEVRDWPGLDAGERRLLAGFLLDNLPPNLHLNRQETLDRQAAAHSASGQVFNQIRKGQVIVRQGDQIGPAAARAIAQMQGDRRPGQRLAPLAGTFCLLALAALVLWLASKGEKVADHGRGRIFGETLLLLLVSLLGTKFCLLVAEALAKSFDAAPLDSLRSYAYAVPFAALPLLAALLLGRNAGLVLAFLFPVLASRMAEGDPLWLVVYGIGGSLAAVFALDQVQFKQRLVVVRVGLVVSLVNVVLVLILVALAGGERAPALIGFDLLCAAVGGLLVAAVASSLVPVLESLLAIATDIKLVELANTNLPLLRRLAFEAPGTFQHSLMVANLAKEGCEAIGADPVLAYTGGLYHDVGKVFRPEYFIENQRTGHNRHDKLLPSMSALILINHVKEGAELARGHNLPRPILDAIEQHHGTRLIKYFYNRALERSAPEAAQPSNDLLTDRAAHEVREEKYRYPGPRPQNKVMGVLMLADAVEAASRTLVEPTPAKIRTLIRTIAEDCLRDGQLDQTDLTLADLETVRESFLRVLSTIFHQRIDYPGFDFNAEPKRERRGSRAEATRAS